MKPGSVVVDLAGDRWQLRTDRAGADRRQARRHHRLPLNLPATMPGAFERAVLKNLLALIELMLGDDAPSPPISTTRCSPRRVSPMRRPPPDVHRASGESPDPGPGRVRRVRRHLQGSQHPAPADVGTNAIHGIVVLGALVVSASSPADAGWGVASSFVALVFGTLNVIGGFAVTDRMLGMFKGKKEAAK